MSISPQSSSILHLRRKEDDKAIEMAWNSLFSKFENLESVENTHELLNIDSTFYTSSRELSKRTGIPGILTENQTVIETQDNSFQKELSKPAKPSNVMSSDDVLEVVREYIEETLQSKLKYYYFKTLASRLKRDGKTDNWIKLFAKELLNLNEKLHIDYIDLYLMKPYPRCSSKAIRDFFEVKHKSKLKKYFDLRQSNPKSNKLIDEFIQYEWAQLRKKVSEKYICTYHSILYGPTALMDEIPDEAEFWQSVLN